MGYLLKIGYFWLNKDFISLSNNNFFNIIYWREDFYVIELIEFYLIKIKVKFVYVYVCRVC